MARPGRVRRACVRVPDEPGIVRAVAASVCSSTCTCACVSLLPMEPEENASRAVGGRVVRVRARRERRPGMAWDAGCGRLGAPYGAAWRAYERTYKGSLASVYRQVVLQLSSCSGKKLSGRSCGRRRSCAGQNPAVSFSFFFLLPPSSCERELARAAPTVVMTLCSPVVILIVCLSCS